MNSAYGGEKTSELFREVFCGIIIAKDLDGSSKLSFDPSTKVLEYSKQFRMIFYQIEPCQTRMVIDKYDKVLEVQLGNNSTWAPDITMV